MTLRILLLTVLAALAVPGLAKADVTLGEGAEQVGRVHLVASSTTTQDVRILEQVDGEQYEIGTTPTDAGVEASVPWTCRQARTFVAIAGDERTAPYTVMTPNCAERLKISTLQDVDLGDDLRVSLVDRWHQGGLNVNVCAVEPDLVSDCRQLELPPGGYVVHTLYQASQPGEWRIDATTQYGMTSHDVRVVRRDFAGGGPTVMFTGDSMMLATRHILRRRLPRRVRTVDDIFVGSGITRPFVIDWSRLPARQVRTYRPDATVISLGMGDSRGLDGAPCCGDDWVAAYAARVRTIMRTYARGGRGAVVWLNLPFGQNPVLWPAQAAVNAAVAQAAVGLRRVQTIDLYAIFTPDGAFHPYLFQGERRTRVRSSDGIHLTLAGARVASRLVMDRLRRLGVTGG